MAWVACVVIIGLYARWEREREPIPATQPLIIAKDNKVYDFCPRAEGQGVCRGDSLLQAQMMLPGVAIRYWPPGGYPELKGVIGQRVAEFTPAYRFLGPHEVFVQVVEPAEAHTLGQRLVAQWGHRVQVGVAPGQVLARVVAHRAKSGGRKGSGVVEVLAVSEDEMAGFLAPLGVDYLWSVDKGIRKRLKRLGLQRVGQVAALPRAWLRREFGFSGELLHHLSCGRDNTRPSLVQEQGWEYYTNFATGVDQDTPLVAFLAATAQRLSQRLNREGQICQELVVVLEFSSGGEGRESHRFGVGVSQDLASILAVLLKLLQQNHRREPVVGVRVIVGKSPGVLQQGDLFQHLLPPVRPQQQIKIHQLISSLQKHYPTLTFGLGQYPPSRREQLLVHWDPFRYRKVPGRV